MKARDDQMPRTSTPVAARVVIGVVMLAIGGGLAWFLSSERAAPAVATTGPIEDPAQAEAVAALRAGSLDREATFDAAVKDEAVPTAEQVKLLEEALRLHQEFLRLQPSAVWADRERERVLVGRIATARGRGMVAHSEKLEQESVDLFAAGDRSGGLKALREAWRLQRDVNLSPADAAVRRTMREAELAERADTIEAEPLAAEVERLETAAQAAATTGDAVAARKFFDEAANFQRRLNQLFARTRFASTARLDRLEGELASLGAREVAAERDRLVDQARAQEAAGAAAEAAALYVQARDAQARINREFAASRYASGPRLEELEIARQTAVSRPRFAVFTALEEKITTALRARRVDEARTFVDQAVIEVSALEKDAPRSQLLTPGWHARVDFLAAIGAVLPVAQADVLDQLQPVPGTRVQMLAGEISQGFYAAVVGENPARVKGNRLPVESLTAAEAEEFCRRLSWALGRVARLPTRAEYTAALGAAGDDAWTAETAGGLPRPVDAGQTNAAGFRNLRGNAAEWVSGTDAGQMVVAGGSYADPAMTPAEGPFRLVPATERFRTVGFRVVVE